MIRSLIRELCVLSILCGAALSLAPEGAARRAMSLVCSVVLLACATGGVKSLDFSDYAVQLSLQREREQAFLQRSEETRDALDRLVMEQEYAAYIRELGGRLSVPLDAVSVKLRWSTEGVWVPDAVRLQGSADRALRETLSGRIASDLGVPNERQEWIDHG